MWLPRSAALKSIHQLFHSQGLARLDDLPVLMTATVLRDVVLHDDDFEDFLDLQATQAWILLDPEVKTVKTIISQGEESEACRYM